MAGRGGEGHPGRGGDRQELHERLREHSIAAAKVVKEQGSDNDLIERVCADPIFKLDRKEIESILEPKGFIGRSVEQVEEFIENCVQPILKENQSVLGESAELSV